MEQSKSKEEGELSSSDDDECPAYSAVQATSTVASPVLSIPVSSADKNAQGIQGKANFGNKLARSVQSQTSIQTDNQKSAEKNQAPFKSVNHQWVAHPGANNNLVISFSDDDSGSELENDKQKKAINSKSNTIGVDGNRRPRTSFLAKSNNLRQTATNVNKVMPKKSSLNPTFISSMTKVNGGVNSRGLGPSPMEQGFRARNIYSLNKNLASQERGCDPGVGFKNTKLQDLRQQIALRESELKLKAAQQNKESFPSRGDINAMNLGNDAAIKCKLTSADVGQLEPKEPDKKRLKASGSCSAQPASGVLKENFSAKSTLSSKEPVLEVSSLLYRTKTAKSTLSSKEPVLEDSSLLYRTKVDCSPKIVPTSEMESSTVEWLKQHDRQINISPKNTHCAVKEAAGADTKHKCNQSERSSRLVDPCSTIKQTESVANMTANNLPTNIIIKELCNPVKIGGHQTPISFLDEAAAGDHKLSSGDRTLEPSFNSMYQASLSNPAFCNWLDTVNVSGHNDTDLHELAEMEESLDKELEEAQEHRRTCEIEERNALKAYRKAQRALVEANARCTSLYRKRELCSAHFRSLIMTDSSLMWSSGRHELVGIELDSSNNLTRNVGLKSMSDRKMRSNYDGINLHGYDSNLQCLNDDHLATSYQRVNGQNLGSEPCSEPDGSTSEPLARISNNATNRASSPSNDPNISADEDEETFPMDHEPSLPNFKYQQKEQYYEGRPKDPNNNLNKPSSTDDFQDSLLLEEALRSKLFARLGMRTSSKTSSPCNNVKPAIDQGAEDDGASDKTQMSNSSFPLTEAEKDQQAELRDDDRSERSFSKAPIQIQNQCHDEKSPLKIHSSAVSDNGGFLTRARQSTPSVIFSPPLILGNAFSHMKVNSSITSLELNHQNHACVVHSDREPYANSDDIQYSNIIGNSMQATVRDSCGPEMGSYTCNRAVDPFWPLCMYELRGKCNNDECPWQHVKNISNGHVTQHQQNDSNTEDCQAGLTLHQQNGTKFFSKCHDVLTAPIYLVGLDILKTDPYIYESLVARNSGQCWRKCFSTTLALSSLFQKDLPEAELFLHGSDGRIEVRGNGSRQSSYFQSRNGITNQLKQAVVNNTQSLETALLILNQEVNREEGIKKALYVLSRALEADPTSEILWTVYLLICYSHTKLVEKDDMFSIAVKSNERSYGLWLMCINSRIRLDDRLATYDAALMALCRHSSVSNSFEMHSSACILDLFLQMMDCLCMSGNVGKALQRIYGLLPSAMSSDESHSPLLSDILTCLTISDKYIFWICCVYLVIYRKLPDAIAKGFECEKELLSIEWTSVPLVDDEKKRAIKLVEFAVDSVQACVNEGLHKSEINLKLAQHFALCHIRCMVALDGLECFRNMLDKYIKLFPSCLELILISARAQKHDCEDSSFLGFEEALSHWPKEVPGIQCIWNQYAEYALQNGRPEFAKELLVLWFRSVWKVKYPQYEFLGATNVDISHGSFESALTSSVDHSVSHLNQMDLMFGLINLSLHKLLQNEHIEAQLAIDRALKFAAPENFKHCMREHAIFLHNDELQLKGEASLSWQLKILNGYVNDARAFPVSVPLTRHFMDNIEKPRVCQLITNLLSPISSDYSLVNSVLEVWYGPSLLPQKFSKPKDLVDFVEAILDIVPSNYPLAFSVCKLLSRDYSSGDVSSASILFWASSTLVNAIFHAIPIAPEYAWVEAAGILGNTTGMEAISVRFYKRALSIYPFSVKLWKCFYNLSNTTGDMNSVVEAAREKGIDIDL
ncbi:zf-C3H1 domain-containing protein [Cephalotus follicularis]|uniref:Zf-C3H1 domain-containing protein n=1 Tax=Cephalotus follicularis TaxID=3775 RepID=A0A1Q3C781_CEPFO|nr:zf-C3H1 domain-containing protein [Cephalotus follicularis]